MPLNHTQLTRRQALKALALVGTLPLVSWHTAQGDNTMFKLGAWLHQPTEDNVQACAAAGITSLRGYTISFADEIAPLLQTQGMDHLAGQHVSPSTLLDDWHAVVNPNFLTRLNDLVVPVTALCVGNELREHNTDRSWHFSPALADNLAAALNAYRAWLDDQPFDLRLSYAAEGNVIDEVGNFQPWVQPVIDAVDIVSINLYPMDGEHWVGDTAFEANRQFLTHPAIRATGFERYEARLRRVLDQLAEIGKPLILSETGFPSGVDFKKQQRWILPIHDNDAFGDAYAQFMRLLYGVRADFGTRFEAIYFYEWMDNLSHDKIQSENSPIHTCFGLVDHQGNPKFDLSRILPPIE